MQKCKDCGKEIKWVATSKDTSIACDAEQQEMYTMLGHKVMGYLVHKCEGKKDDGSEK